MRPIIGWQECEPRLSSRLRDRLAQPYKERAVGSGPEQRDRVRRYQATLVSTRRLLPALTAALVAALSASCAWADAGLAARVAHDSDLRDDPRVIRYLALTDEATLRNMIPRGEIAEPFAYSPAWIPGPNGLPVLRFSSVPSNQRLISWFLRFEPQQEVYARYCLLIEDDVADGMTELGVKLPGLAGDEVSWRMEHGPVVATNRGLYTALDYFYGAETGAGYGAIRSMNVSFKADLWYVIEQYVKLNTPGRDDGIGKVWINGQLVWDSDHVRYRDKASSSIDHLHVNVYHGGMGLPKGPMHYRLAGIVVAKDYIGPPPELAAIIKPEPMLPRTGRVPEQIRR